MAISTTNPIKEVYYNSQNVPLVGGICADENDVNFFDYDGTIVDSYSATEFASLTEIPSNPSHTGLVAQGWNWSLSDAKTYVGKYGRLNIGQMYTTESGDTEIDVCLETKRLSPILTICVNGSIMVDWGDGKTRDDVSGSSLTTRQAVPHEYSSPGDYTIKIHVVSGECAFYGEKTYNYTILRKNTNQYENYIYAKSVRAIRINGTTNVGDYAFMGCANLSSVTMSRGVSDIGGYAFYACTNLPHVTIPDGVINTGHHIFNSCYSLSSVAIPNGVTNIGDYAFYTCRTLSSLTIPDSVTSISSNSTFSNCGSLSTITMPDVLTALGAGMFSHCGSLLNINIPDAVTSISSSAFTNCHSLTKITIPANVTSIARYAFQYDGGMQEYHLKSATPPTLENTNAFNNIASDCIIYVPYSADHSVLNAYQTATNWSTYASYMQEEENVK